MIQDFYELLQVHPRANQDAITAAYERLVVQYDEERLAGAAPELIALAREKRELLSLAYATLSDPDRRAAYDVELAEAEEDYDDDEDEDEDDDVEEIPHRHNPKADASTVVSEIDYRPLPPANRNERPKDFDLYPERLISKRKAKRARSQSLGQMLTAIGLVLAGVIALSYIVTILETPKDITTTQTTSAMDSFEAAIAETLAIAQQNPTVAQAWVDHGNMLYNSVAMVRENQPGSTLYIDRLPRWLQAAEAYQRALDLDPSLAVSRSDMGVSMCFYGRGVNDNSYVQSGLAASEQAYKEQPTNPRVLLNYGNCLISDNPPQRAEALNIWQQVAQYAEADSPLITQAQQLISVYSE
jgi:tetratricopeptide (TPR) repeat protein